MSEETAESELTEAVARAEVTLVYEIEYDTFLEDTHRQRERDGLSAVLDAIRNGGLNPERHDVRVMAVRGIEDA